MEYGSIFAPSPIAHGQPTVVTLAFKKAVSDDPAQVSWTSPAGGGSLRPGLAHQRRPQTHRGDAGGEGDSNANACDHDGALMSTLKWH